MVYQKNLLSIIYFNWIIFLIILWYGIPIMFLFCIPKVHLRFRVFILGPCQEVVVFANKIIAGPKLNYQMRRLT